MEYIIGLGQPVLVRLDYLGRQGLHLFPNPTLCKMCKLVFRFHRKSILLGTQVHLHHIQVSLAIFHIAFFPLGLDHNVNNSCNIYP